MPLKPVDTAIKVIVGPAIDDTDFKTREEALAYNQAGMEVDVILEKHDGTVVTTAVTPTTGGNYDWAHTDQGYYELELPASGGASFNNTEEGVLRVAVYCTGVLPFGSVSYDVVPTQVYNSIVKGTDYLDISLVQWLGVAPNALQSGRVDSYIGALAAAVITAAGIAADAIGSSEFAQAAADKVWGTAARTLTDKAGFTISGTKTTLDALNDITAAAVKTAIEAAGSHLALIKAVTDVESGVKAAVAALNNISAAQVNAEMVDVLGVDTLSELGIAIPAKNPTIKAAIMLMYMALRDKLDVDANYKEIHNDAGSVICKKALSDNGTIYSEAKAESG